MDIWLSVDQAKVAQSNEAKDVRLIEDENSGSRSFMINNLWTVMFAPRMHL